MFTEIKIDDKIELTLAPLSILPEYQGRGIGMKLCSMPRDFTKQWRESSRRNQNDRKGKSSLRDAL